MENISGMWIGTNPKGLTTPQVIYHIPLIGVGDISLRGWELTPPPVFKEIFIISFNLFLWYESDRPFTFLITS